MNAELYGSQHPSEQEGVTPVTVTEASETSRVEMEHSVLDALRPFLPKKRKSAVETPPTESASQDDALVPDAHEAPEDDPVLETLASSVAALSDGEDLDMLPLGLGRDPHPVEGDFETFAAIGEDLERRSRKSATMARLLEQHRQQLLTAERERDSAYEQLSRVVPIVQETAHLLREAMDARKVEDDTARMHKLFMLNGRALDELEKVATELFADFLWVKSAWEQYARSVEDARKLRSSLDA